MKIDEKIEKYLISEESFKYDTVLADNVSNHILNNLGKNSYNKGEKLIKDEIKSAKKRTGYKGKNWKELLQQAVDNLEVMYDYELHDQGGTKGNKIDNFIDILRDTK